jgi:outer membrane protein assembly factor BamB
MRIDRRVAGAAAALLVIAAGGARAEAIFVTNGSAIDEYSLSGQFLQALTAPSVTSGAFSPQGLAFGSDGKLYAADRVAHDLAVFDPASGAFLGRVGSIAPGDSSVSLHGLALAPGGNLVGLTNQDQLFSVDPVANTTTVQQIDILNSSCCATFLAVDSSGRTIGSSASDDAIYDIGTQQLIASLQSDVTGVAFGPNGAIFAVNGNQIDKIDGGNVSVFATSSLLVHDGNGGDLAFDSLGDLWVSSPNANLLLEFSSSGALIHDFCTAANGGDSCGGAPNFLVIGPAASNLGVAEPATWTMMLVGFLGVGGAVRAARRRGGPSLQPC